jgi:hypothetical protein
MSERFLEGFIVDPKAIDALIGTPKLAAKAVRKKLGKTSALRDVEMTLAESYDDAAADEGGKQLDALLDALAKGRPGKSHDAYEMTRLVTLILAAYATRLGTIELVPYVEGDDFGLLTPVLKALKLAQMAKDYGASSFAFPYRKVQQVDWPIVTCVTELAAWQNELATDWAKRLPALADKPFVDKRYGTEPDAIAETKADVAAMLATLKTWVGKACKQEGRALVLILDGDQ